MNEDSGLDTFMEDHINGGYGHIMDEVDARDSAGDIIPEDVDGSGEDDEPCEPDDSMDGDFDSAMASAGHGTDEDYGGGTHDWECDGE